MKLAFYEDEPSRAELPVAATYVFTDVDRLSASGAERAAGLADSLAGLPGGPTVLNHPRRVLRRYELLRALHERGVNPFRAHRVLETRVPARFPVFLKFEDRHDGPDSPLLRTQRELDRAVAQLFRASEDLSSLLMIEFDDVSDEDGMFHRQVTYVIGEELIHGNLAFGTNWVVKYGGAATGAQLEAQRAASESTTHDPLLRELASHAGVGYGRFDYSIVAGGIRVWELNTNPTLLLAADEYPPEVRAERQVLADRLTDALGRLAGKPDAGRSIRIPDVRRDDKPPPRRGLGTRARAMRWRLVSTLVARLPARAAWSAARAIHRRRARR